jgi:hypothetical protein
MDKLNPSSEFEKKVAMSAATPDASPEFTAHLRSQLLTAAKTTVNHPSHSLWQRLGTWIARPRENARWLASAIGTIAVLGAVIIIALNQTTPVSAQQILERATAAQSAADSGRGIRHMRIESYQNMQGLSGPQAGTTTFIESYENTATDSSSSRILEGLFRSVTTDVNGKVIDASSTDGSYFYSTYPLTPGSDANSLVIHRTPVRDDDRKKPTRNQVVVEEQSIFDQFRSNPRVELMGKETRKDGRQVYRLIDRNYQIEAQSNGKETKTFTGSMTMLFDAQTYQLMESIRIVRKGGEDIILNRVSFLTDEVLPTETSVAWDLSDIRGAKVVDEKPQNGTEEPVNFKAISEHELASHVMGFVLKPLPEGFAQKILYAPKQAGDDHDICEINYDKSGENVFGMMFVGKMDTGFVDASFYDGSYKTATGLVINFSTGSGRGTSGILTVPDGTSFLLRSSLGREEVQRLAEKLVLAQ